MKEYCMFFYYNHEDVNLEQESSSVDSFLSTSHILGAMATGSFNADHYSSLTCEISEGMITPCLANNVSQNLAGPSFISSLPLEGMISYVHRLIQALCELGYSEGVHPENWSFRYVNSCEVILRVADDQDCFLFLSCET
jgi:hypothetical protein